jgi:hypothetical protein
VFAAGAAGSGNRFMGPFGAGARGYSLFGRLKRRQSSCY